MILVRLFILYWDFLLLYRGESMIFIEEVELNVMSDVGVMEVGVWFLFFYLG